MAADVDMAFYNESDERLDAYISEMEASQTWTRHEGKYAKFLKQRETEGKDGAKSSGKNSNNNNNAPNSRKIHVAREHLGMFSGKGRNRIKKIEERYGFKFS